MPGMISSIEACSNLSRAVHEWGWPVPCIHMPFIYAFFARKKCEAFGTHARDWPTLCTIRFHCTFKAAHGCPPEMNLEASALYTGSTKASMPR
eukprot:scaffold11075_cov23-Tisochrysis_lutea.AAC.6